MTTSRDNQNSKLIPVAIIVFGILAGYLYYSRFSSSQSVSLINPAAQDNLSKFKDLKSFNLSIINNEKFKALKVIGEAPVQPDPNLGRDDPFAAF